MMDKFLHLRVRVRRGAVFLGGFNKIIGIDWSAAIMDTSACAFVMSYPSTYLIFGAGVGTFAATMTKKGHAVVTCI